MSTAQAVKARGAKILRGGAYKPRTSPYEFQGLGREGLRILAAAKQETGLKIITEVLSERDVEHVCEFADVLQVGARNAQNFQLLIECAKSRKPVLLKRGMSERIEEWLLAAEYILSNGNPNVCCANAASGPSKPILAIPWILPQSQSPRKNPICRLLWIPARGVAGPIWSRCCAEAQLPLVRTDF